MEAGGVISGRFRLISLAGRGVMGEVWKAADESVGGSLVAVKSMLDPDAAVDRFVRESALLSRVRHPALVSYVAHGVEQGAPWLAMDWVDGESLALRLSRAPLSLGETLVVARSRRARTSRWRLSTAVAIDVAHAARFRDLRSGRTGKCTADSCV